MTPRRIAGILLAAGSAERMGFDKLLTPLAGKTALLRSAEALVQGGVTELVAAVSERRAAQRGRIRSIVRCFLRRAQTLRSYTMLRGVL